MDPSADVHMLSGAYAAGAVDDVERAAFERHLQVCADCTDEVRALRETLVRLAEGAAVTPPQGLRLHVLDQIRATAQDRRQVPSAAVPRPQAPRTPWLVAAAFALLAAGAGSLAWNQHSAAESAQQLAAVVADPAARRVTGTATDGGDVTLVRAGGRAAVLTSALPGLPAGRAYQLWIVRPGAITSAGLGPAERAAAGSWSRLVDGVRAGDVVAISVEPSGGSQQPTSTPIVTLQA